MFYDITASAEGRQLFTEILTETASTVFIPVSYTHLDVYKRQANTVSYKFKNARVREMQERLAALIARE